MPQLINLLIYVVIFAVGAYGAYWICVKFKAPDPVFWIVGLILILILLVFLSGQVGLGPGINVFGHR